GHVDIDVVLILRIDDKRMGVRAAASLHCGYLPGIPDVRYIEDPHAAEPILLRRRDGWLFLFAEGGRRRGWKSLRAAIESAVWHLDRHKHQVLINGRVSLT